MDICSKYSLIRQLDCHWLENKFIPGAYCQMLRIGPFNLLNMPDICWSGNIGQKKTKK